MNKKYKEYVESLFQRAVHVKGRRDLKTVLLLDEGLKQPSHAYATIHVAGSNGKGSVATKIAASLQAQGYRVGLYTSPHLFTFRERIMINSENISEEAVAALLPEIISLETKLGLQASFFELMTVLAFTYFARQNVAIAVIETGLGGRWDATNVIHPLCSIITSISREHEALLGHGLESIAAEKAGIIKENTPVILGPKARFMAIYEKAKQLNAPVYLSDVTSSFFDEENSAIAQVALEHLPFQLCLEAIEKGLWARPPCRFENKGGVIFDVAHNPDAISHLLKALNTFFPKRPLRFVLGFSKDKNYGECLTLIFPVAVHIHLVEASTPRSAALVDLHQSMQSLKTSHYSLHPVLSEGVKEAYECALKNEELLVIAGTFYMMADAQKALKMAHPSPDILDLNEKIFSWVSPPTTSESS